MEIITKKITELKLSPYNPRKNLTPNDPEYQKLKKSILEFDYIDPIIWNQRSQRVVGGNQRLKILKEIGRKEVEVSVVDLPDNKEKALCIALNKHSGEWDYPKLKDLIIDIDVGNLDIEITGFDEGELKNIFDWEGKVEFGEAPEAQVDRADELNKIWKVKQGDLWQIGQHRLLCGDSTKGEDVARVMGSEKVEICFADPPWNVKWKYDKYEDDLTPEQYKIFSDSWRIQAERNGACFFLVAMSMRNYQYFAQWFPMTERIFAECQNFVQHTPEFMQYAFNPILVWGKVELVSVAGQRDYYIAETSNTRNTSDKILAKLNAATRWLPTWIYIIENFTIQDATIYEPFLGSGTTLIACENLKRRCFGIEISPAYCSVVLERAKTAFPNIEIKRI